jgi:hypothetical protein
MPIKPNDGVLQSIQKDIIGVRRAMANVEIINDGKDSPLGKSLYQMFKLLDENSDATLGGFIQLTDRQVTATLQQKATARFFLGLFDDGEKNMDDLKEKLNTLIIREKAYRAKLSAS